MENVSIFLMNDLTLEECFIKYHTQHIACICNGDGKLIAEVEE